MKTKNRKTAKIIFSSLMALCVFCSVFFIYNNQSFASSVSVSFNTSALSSFTTYGAGIGYRDTSGTAHVIYSYNSSLPSGPVTLDSSSYSNFLCFYVYQAVRIYNFNTGSYSTKYLPVGINGTYFSSDYNNPTVLTGSSFTFVIYGSSGSTSSRFFTFEQPTPTPTPTPAPTPTPTPDPYGPGPVPTIPPGEANYTSFFNRLASDAQNAFNAIFLSWQNANNKFYSGLFFIGFPVLLGIIGLVASIFFGDDDL